MYRLRDLHIDDDSKSGANVEAFKILVLLLCLGVSFQDEALHEAVGFVDSFFDEFLDCELIDKLAFQKRLLYLSSSDRVLSDLITDQSHRGDVHQIVELSKTLG